MAFGFSSRSAQAARALASDRSDSRRSAASGLLGLPGRRRPDRGDRGNLAPADRAGRACRPGATFAANSEAEDLWLLRPMSLSGRACDDHRPGSRLAFWRAQAAGQGPAGGCRDCGGILATRSRGIAALALDSQCRACRCGRAPDFSGSCTRFRRSHRLACCI